MVAQKHQHQAMDSKPPKWQVLAVAGDERNREAERNKEIEIKTGDDRDRETDKDKVIVSKEKGLLQLKVNE